MWSRKKRRRGIKADLEQGAGLEQGLGAEQGVDQQVGVPHHQEERENGVKEKGVEVGPEIEETGVEKGQEGEIEVGVKAEVGTETGTVTGVDQERGGEEIEAGLGVVDIPCLHISLRDPPLQMAGLGLVMLEVDNLIKVTKVIKCYKRWDGKVLGWELGRVG